MPRARGRGPHRRRLGTATGVAGLVLLALVLPPSGAAVGAGPQLEAAALPGNPAEPLVVSTIPPVAGFPVQLDDVTVLTDSEGRATFPTRGEGDLTGRVGLTEAVVPIGGRDVKVAADRFHPSGAAPTLALDLSYLVRFRYTDRDGTPIDADSLDRITLRSNTGQVVEADPQQPAWLQGSRVVQPAQRLIVKNLDWSVQRVEVDGTTVVNASQQRFSPATQQDVAVRLLFFDVDLQVHDAVFGFPTGNAVALAFPDGRTERYPLDAHGQVSLPPLPRGDYTLTMLGLGPEMPRPIAVSSDLELELTFYSWLDISVVVGALAALALGLLVAGRFRRRRDVDGPRGAYQGRHRWDPDGPRGAYQGRHRWDPDGGDHRRAGPPEESVADNPRTSAVPSRTGGRLGTPWRHR
jgi:hypothetical protein